MLVYYFVPFIVSNRYILFWVSNAYNSVTVQNRTHVYMNFFDHKDLGNHLLQLCPKVVKHSVYLFETHYPLSLPIQNYCQTLTLRGVLMVVTLQERCPGSLLSTTNMVGCLSQTPDIIRIQVFCDVTPWIVREFLEIFKAPQPLEILGTTQRMRELHNRENLNTQ